MFEKRLQDFDRRPPKPLTPEQQTRADRSNKAHRDGQAIAKETGKPVLVGSLIYGRDGKTLAYTFAAGLDPDVQEQCKTMVQMAGGTIIEVEP